MEEILLLQFDKIIGDFSKVFMLKNSGRIFDELVRKYEFRLADNLVFTDNLQIKFFYQPRLKIGINSLFLNGALVSFSIIHFW